MTKLSIVGKITDRIGAAEYHSTPRMEGGRAVEHRRYEQVSALEYRSQQPPRIAVTMEHRGRPLGHVLHLEVDADQAVWAVCEIDGVDQLLVPSYGPHYYSPELIYERGGRNVTVVGLALTEGPATVGLSPVEVTPGDVAAAADRVRCRHRPALAARLDRAALAQRRRGIGGAISIEDPSAPGRLAHRSVEDSDAQPPFPVPFLIGYGPRGRVISVR